MANSCFFFTSSTPTQIYTLSLHDALPIFPSRSTASGSVDGWSTISTNRRSDPQNPSRWRRSEEHTSELQSLRHLVCRLLLEKKKRARDRGPRGGRCCGKAVAQRVRSAGPQ